MSDGDASMLIHSISIGCSINRINITNKLYWIGNISIDKKKYGISKATRRFMDFIHVKCRANVNVVWEEEKIQIIPKLRMVYLIFFCFLIFSLLIFNSTATFIL